MATTAVTARATKPTLRERLDLGSGIMPYLLVVPTLLIILLIAVYPIIQSIWDSFLTNPLISTNSTFAGVSNYLRIFGDPIFRGTISTTVVFSVISVALETVFGLGIALLINKIFPGRGLVRAAILIPWAFPTVVSAQIWNLMYNDQTGIITFILQKIHILAPGDTLLRTPGGVLTASIITDVWKTTPFMALLILAGLQVIPGELYEAASVDGSSRWQQFWTITLPMLKNSLLIALLFRTLDAIRVFDVFYVFTGGGRSVQTMATYSYNLMFQGTTPDFAPGVTAAVVIFIFGIIISLLIVPWMRSVMRQD